MSETVNLTSGYTFVTGESVTAPKLNAQLTGGTVEVFDGNPTGVMMPYLGSSQPTGWVFANGLTIGNANSNATLLADNVTSFALFSLFWDDLPSANDGNLVMLQSGGADVGTKGATALIDFDLNYHIPVPNMNGRMPIGVRDMGDQTEGTDAGPITIRTGKEDLFTKMGHQNGRILLSAGDLPYHAHEFGSVQTETLNDGSSTYPQGANYSVNPAIRYDSSSQQSCASYDTLIAKNSIHRTSTSSTSVATNLDNATGNTGNDQGVMQPSITTSYIIKL